MSGLLGEIDALYELAVTQPDRVTDQSLADWADGVANGYEVDKASTRYVRRSMNVARKLAAFWDDRATAGAPPDWRSRVDLALGARAWRPQLELAEHLLIVDASPEVFDAVVGLFPLVRNQPYLDGISYDEWLEDRAQR